MTCDHEWAPGRVTAGTVVCGRCGCVARPRDTYAMHTWPREPIGYRDGMTTHGPGRMPIYRAEDAAAGRRFRDARVAAGVSLRGLASLLGMTAVDLSRVEQGAAVWRDPGAALAEVRRALESVTPPVRHAEILARLLGSAA